MDTAEFLAHFDVKGMKWGVRKEQLKLSEGQALMQRLGYDTGSLY